MTGTSQTAVEPVALAQALKNLTEGAEQEDREILYAAASTLTAQAAALVAAEKALRARNQDALIWQSLCKDGEIALRAAESEVATLKARIAELEAGLEQIEGLDAVEAALDPEWAGRTARAVLRRLTHQEKNNGR